MKCCIKYTTTVLLIQAQKYAHIGLFFVQRIGVCFDEYAIIVMNYSCLYRCYLPIISSCLVLCKKTKKSYIVLYDFFVKSMEFESRIWYTIIQCLKPGKEWTYERNTEPKENSGRRALQQHHRQPL